jgi:hypothetical protein
MHAQLRRAAVVLILLLTPAAGRTSSSQSELVIVKEGTSQYHRPGCDLIRDGKGVLAMTRAQAEARELKSHDGCDPSKVPPPPAAGEKRPAGPVFVYLDASGKQYHRENCRRLTRDQRKKVNLEDVWRKYWPCNVCKPPVRRRPAK